MARDLLARAYLSLAAEKARQADAGEKTPESESAILRFKQEHLTDEFWQQAEDIIQQVKGTKPKPKLTRVRKRRE